MKFLCWAYNNLVKDHKGSLVLDMITNTVIFLLYFCSSFGV